MEKLKSIIACLNSSEKKRLVSFYTQEGKRTAELKYQLFNLILESPNITSKDACFAIYNKPPNNSFSNLKRQLIEDLVNIVITQPISALSTDFWKAICTCYKNILAGIILFNRNESILSTHLLEDALKKAQKSELYSACVYLKMILVTIYYNYNIESKKKRDKSFVYLNSIDNDISSLKRLVNVSSIGMKLQIYNWEHNDNRDYFSTIKRFGNDLNLLDIPSNEIRANYQQLHYLLFCHRKTRDFDNYLTLFDSYLSYVMPESILHSYPRLIASYVSRAEVDLLTENYDSGVFYIKKTLSYANVDWHRFVAYRLFFLIQLHSKKYTEARSTLDYCVEEFENKINKNNYSVLNIYSACLYLQKGDLDNARVHLYKYIAIVKNRPETMIWVIGYKMVEIMISIKEKEGYLLDTQLNNLQKLINNHKYIKALRFRVICKIVRVYLNTGFNKRETLKKASKHLSILSQPISIENEYYYNPNSSEVIRFDRWFKEL